MFNSVLEMTTPTKILAITNISSFQYKTIPRRFESELKYFIVQWSIVFIGIQKSYSACSKKSSSRSDTKSQNRRHLFDLRERKTSNIMAEAMLMLPRSDAQQSWSSLHNETLEKRYVSPSSSFLHDYKPENAQSLTCQPVSSSSYYESNQGSGYTRVPCRARGVSNDHNAQNAYIDIPRNAPHGMILQCSNKDCAGSGRRFRYCSVCQTPAAKRNFHVRHAHGMSLLKGVRDRSLVASRPQTPPHLKRRRSSRKVSGSSEEIAAMAKQAIRELTIEHQQVEEVREPPKKVGKSVCSEEERELSPEEIEWLKLLRNRPNFDNNEQTETWLSSVIECSLAIEPAELPLEVKTYDTMGARDADEILTALECSEEENFEGGDGEFQFDFNEEGSNV
jgi:hypothetical protein